MIPKKTSSSMSRRNRNEGPSESFQEALRALDRDGAAAATVQPLSDLSRADARALRQAWSRLARETRYRCVSLMASLSSEELRYNFERALVVALSDEDPDIRTLAADALWESESSTLLDELLRLLAREDTQQARVAVINALGRYARLASEDQLSSAQRESLERALLDVADNDPRVDVRSSAMAAVAYLRPASLGPAVERAFDEGDDAERLAAVQAMGRYGGREWASRIIDALRGGDSELRIEAARAAPYVEDTRVVAFLFDAAEDEDDPELQVAAISALGEVGGEQVRRFLEEMRDTTTGEIAQAAEEALAHARLLDGDDTLLGLF